MPIKRIQRKRTKGFRLPPNTICVSRPSKFSNPFRDMKDMVYVWAGYRRSTSPWIFYTMKSSSVNAASLFRDMLMDLNSHEVEPEIRDRFRFMRDNITSLGQYEYIACFCSLDAECHADSLIELLTPKSQTINF